MKSAAACVRFAAVPLRLTTRYRNSPPLSFHRPTFLSSVSMDEARVAELKTQGNEAYRQEDWGRARDLYSEALKAAEKAVVDSVLLSSLWSNRSASLACLEDYESALTDAEKAISLRGDWSRGYARKAVALMGANKTEAAAETIKKGLTYDPDDEMLVELGELLAVQEKQDEGEEAAEEEDNTLSEAVETIRASNVKSSLPVVVISGFLGSGKTTLLKHMLTQKGSEKRIALLVNDMAEINIDADLIRNVHEVTETSEELIELTNGCVCCTLRGDLIKAATQIICSKKFDLMVIEATGISEPMPVAATFTTEDVNGSTLEEFFSIDNMVTLVDCSRFLEELKNGETLKQKNMAAFEEDERHVSQLLIDQIEFANTVLLNKCDLVSKERILQVKGLVKEMNPEGHILESIKSNVDLTEILDTKRFSVAWANEAEGFKTELINPHTSETEEYGISSVIFRSRIPFHPERLHEFFFGPGEVTDEDRIAEKSPLHGVYRSKGVFYLASKMNEKLSWSTAGRNVVFELLDRWQVAMLPQEMWPKANEEWDSTWGDREQKIVLIGNKDQLQEVLKSLKTCLINQEEQELGEQKWTELDPKKLWDTDEEEDSDDGDNEDAMSE